MDISTQLIVCLVIMIGILALSSIWDGFFLRMPLSKTTSPLPPSPTDTLLRCVPITQTIKTGLWSTKEIITGYKYVQVEDEIST